MSALYVFCFSDTFYCEGEALDVLLDRVITIPTPENAFYVVEGIGGVFADLVFRGVSCEGFAIWRAEAILFYGCGRFCGPSSDMHSTAHMHAVGCSFDARLTHVLPAVKATQDGVMRLPSSLATISTCTGMHHHARTTPKIATQGIKLGPGWICNLAVAVDADARVSGAKIDADDMLVVLAIHPASYGLLHVSSRQQGGVRRHHSRPLGRALLFPMN